MKPRHNRVLWDLRRKLMASIEQIDYILDGEPGCCSKCEKSDVRCDCVACATGRCVDCYEKCHKK